VVGVGGDPDFFAYSVYNINQLNKETHCSVVCYELMGALFRIFYH